MNLAYHKAAFWSLYSTLCTPPHSILSSPNTLASVIISMRMILKHIFHFPLNMHYPPALSIIESCIKDVFSWLVAYKFSANPNKTEYLLFNSRNINPQVININLDSDIISLSYSAKNLGVLFQSDMSLDNHISSIFKFYFVQLRDFRWIRSLISRTADITLAHSFIHSCLDYFNSLFYGIPNYSITISKRFKIQLLALSLLVSVHHTSLWF